MRICQIGNTDPSWLPPTLSSWWVLVHHYYHIRARLVHNLVARPSQQVDWQRDCTRAVAEELVVHRPPDLALAVASGADHIPPVLVVAVALEVDHIPPGPAVVASEADHIRLDPAVAVEVAHKPQAVAVQASAHWAFRSVPVPPLAAECTPLGVDLAVALPVHTPSAEVDPVDRPLAVVPEVGPDIRPEAA